jgi:tape measure domain-containing protein
MATDTKLQIIVDARDNTSAALSSVSKHLGNLHGYMQNATTASRQFAAAGSILTGVLSGIGYMGLRTSADLETAQVGLTTLLGSAEDAAKTIAEIKRVAASTPFEVNGLARATQLLASVTHDGPRSVKVLSDIGEALVAMGKGNEELDRIMVNLQQVGALGHASMVDIKQFAYAGIPIFEMLKSQTGLTGDALDSFVADGKVTFDMLTAMFDKANDSGGQFFNAYKNNADSFNQIQATMRESISLTVSNIMNQSGAFDFAKNAMKRFTEYLTSHQADIVAAIKGIVDYLKEHKEVAIILVGVIAGALAPAFIALAYAIGTTMLALAPFMLGGAVIAGLFAFREQIYGILEQTGLINTFTWAWQVLAGVWNDSLKPSFMGLWEALKPLMPFLQSMAKILGFELVIAIKAFVLALTVIIKIVAEVLAAITNLETYLINGFMGAWNKVSGAIGAAIDKIQRFIDLAKEAANYGLNVGKSAYSSISNIVQKILPVNDGVISPSGALVSTHPDDYIIATKNPASLGGGGLTINITGNTLLDDNAGEKIGDLIMRRLRLSNAI